ncbi:MAG: DUF2093 domain-containing protein [Pseudomonadota bacterium]
MLLSNKNRMAKLHYLPGTFRIVSSGDHVVCAVSGERIGLEDLRYWSVERQEPYATAEISVQQALAGADR